VYLEDKNNEGLSRRPKQTQMFCMDLIKEQFLKHLFDMIMETDPKPNDCVTINFILSVRMDMFYD